ncbi:MAG: AIR synthase-related protein [Acidobacteria bacterium]|nr:AIR synthase-related protein [Acidobacteriota bacterium]
MIQNSLLDRFFRPPSQTSLGKKLSEKGISVCAIDISDGLLKDLSRILKESGVGAIVKTEEIPRFALTDGKKASLKSALSGGEEQTLLFTVSPEKEELLSKNKIKAFKIGTIISKKELLLEGKRIIKKANAEGFDHFSQK